MEKMTDIPEAVVDLGAKLKILSGVVWTLASLASFGIFYYCWYLVVQNGFSTGLGVNMTLALIFAMGTNGMVRK